MLNSWTIQTLICTLSVPNYKIFSRFIAFATYIYIMSRCITKVTYLEKTNVL